MYGVLISPDLISQVTDAVMEEVREWQNRPDEGMVKNKAVYLALGVLPDGTKDGLACGQGGIFLSSQRSRASKPNSITLEVYL